MPPRKPHALTVVATENPNPQYASLAEALCAAAPAIAALIKATEQRGASEHLHLSTVPALAGESAAK